MLRTTTSPIIFVNRFSFCASKSALLVLLLPRPGVPVLEDASELELAFADRLRMLPPSEIFFLFLDDSALATRAAASAAAVVAAAASAARRSFSFASRSALSLVRKPCRSGAGFSAWLGSDSGTEVREESEERRMEGTREA